ncbi:metallophosphatase [Christiangramia fulva]|uniref:Metallophosphatase n=1 Tax=Christiangramia fulva TaxID=2126553 RepID=A0A2R3Z301_9FLAO|nr:metallophosphatase [Christiangramia fulva]
MFLFWASFTGSAQQKKDGKESVHSVYITANTALRDNSTNKKLFEAINAASKKGDSATLLIIGNIVPENGYPNKDDGRKEVQKDLKKHLLELLQDFKGRIVFTPGVNEWQADAPDNIDDLESFLQDNSRAEFWPNDGCPIEGEDLNDDVHLVTVDSQWYLEDWDEHPYINNKCDLKTRDEFILEFADELKDNQGKIILVAIHHPIMSNTKQGIFERIIGAGTQNFRNPKYKELRQKLQTLATRYNDVIFLSGNDRNLQFVQDDGIEQIISGVTSDPEKAKVRKDKGGFAAYDLGYARVTTFKDGSSEAEFYEIGKKNPIFTTPIKRERTKLSEVSWHSKDEFGKTKKASIYSEEETDKNWLYKALWGEHYRPIYSRKIEFPVLLLDTIPGNLKPVGEGGGHQSRSLRFRDDEGHEYTLRALKKSALRFLQKSVPTHYVEDYLQNTVAERYVQDFYTTAHPYAPYATFPMMDSLNIKHATPKIYYVPKQKALGIYNKDYGDALFMWQPHVGDENKDFEQFGNPDDILSSKDLLLELEEDKDAYVDQELYIRARIFDMLIGDWDRHPDQWRWAEYKEGDRKRYEPIPRDRDHAFPKYDGFLVKLLKLGVLELRPMENYDAMLDNPKWFNVEAYPVDKAFLKTATWQEWKEQVEYIQDEIDNELIEKAFNQLPEGAKDESIKEIKKKLIARRANLMKIARQYYEHLREYDMIIGTEDDDTFLITRKPAGATNIQIINEDGEKVFDHSYTSNLTRQLWLYGLDGEDTFRIEGEGDDLIKLKVLGGEENDIYDFKNHERAKLYDYKSKENTIKTPEADKWLVDSYSINHYDPFKKMIRDYKLLPGVDFSSDTGLKLGLANVYTTYGLVQNPFTTQQKLSANYFFATNGFDIEYNGEFANILYKWNVAINAYYSSPNFTMNYFGAGNETEYDKDEDSRDFNRIRIEQWHFAPSLIWKNDDKSSFYFKPMIESFEVAYDQNRFIGENFSPDNEIFDSQLYGGAELNYNYYSKNREAYPSEGMELDLTAGYKKNIDEHSNEFGYISPMLSIDYPLHPSGVAVFATRIGGKAILGENYEFYHAAVLGGGSENTLRGYRNERFNGKYSFYQNIDLRTGFASFKTNFIPIRLGLSLGFDYGRVWLDDNNSNAWHNDYGGSFFVNAFSFFTGNIGYYTGEDGGRFNFTFNFKF